MRIAVTGANGWLGRAVCARLAQSRNVPVRFVRKAAEPDDFEWDLAKSARPRTLIEVLASCDAIVHCAAHVHQPVEDAQQRRLFQEVNVRGTAQLIEGCREARVKRILLVSSIAVYDWRSSAQKSESSPIRGLTAYAQSKVEAEHLWRNSGLDWRIARLATMYGAGDHANFLKLARALSRRRFIVPGNGGARKSVIPVHVAADLLAALVEEEHLSERIVNLACPEAPSLLDICQSFAKVCEFPQPVRVPLVFCRGLAFLGDMVSASRVVASPFHSEVLRKLTSDSVVSTTLLESMFPHYPWPAFQEALRTAAEFYRRN